MKGDFSRDTFKKKKHYSRVLHQQGRVQLDSDINEQTSIMLHYLRTTMTDLVGPYGGPAEDLGFEILVEQNISTQTEETKDNPYIQIRRGRYYVDGILCEIEEDILFNEQEFIKAEEYFDLNSPLNGKSCYLFYLQVWERYISHTEDDAIREKALGGPDTAGRAQVIWQVKQFKFDKPSPDNKECLPAFCDDPCENYFEPMCRVDQEKKKRWYFKSLGLEEFKKFKNKQSSSAHISVGLLATVSIGGNDTESKYFGPENQLYRVEIHNRGRYGEATFKWSRDNGTHVTLIDKIISKKKQNHDEDQRSEEAESIELIVDVLDARGFLRDNWVELIDDISELRGEPGVLVKLKNITSNTLTFVASNDLEEYLLDHKTLQIKARRWDQIASSEEAGVIRIKDNLSIDLEDGLRVQFQCPDGAEFKTGDYWIIPARAATGAIEWEKDKFIPPMGIQHSYAPLAVLDLTDGKPALYDLRSKFFPFRGYIENDNIPIKKLRKELRIWKVITVIFFIFIGFLSFLAWYFCSYN